MPDEIIIKIKRRRRKGTHHSPLTTQHSPTGILRPRTDSDYQARRLLKKSALKFFDAGQKLIGGAWYDKTIGDFFALLDITPTYQEAGGEQIGWLFTSRPPMLPDVQNFVSGQIGALSEDEKREVKKSNSSVFPIFVFGFTGTIQNPTTTFTYFSTDENSQWTDGAGLTLTDGQRTGKIIFGSTSGYVSSFGIYEGNKITESFDFNAEAIENFHLGADAQIILIPAINEARAYATIHLNNLSERRQIIGFDFRHKPRFFDYPNTPIETNHGNQEVYERFIAAGGRYPLDYDFYFNSPHIRDEPENGRNSFNLEDENFQVVYLQIPPIVGQLVGVIKQGEKTYYFWQL